MKKWKIINKTKNQNILEMLLENRGIKTKKEKEEFLNPPDPHTLTPKDVGIDSGQLRKAIDRMNKAIKNKEKIIVYGDYDSDGVCATAILWETLWETKANAMPFIPTREEGYGMKKERLDEFIKSGVSLVITVDQGIVAYEQAEYAKKIGLDLIVTDHHLPGEKKAKTFATIHTTSLCGAAVSWFLANQIKKTDLDLATIGTITDLMPLTGINRSIVYHGLIHLRNTKRLGLQELFKAAGINLVNIGTYEIGFIIGPRINAAGRMEDPMDALRLVCTKKFSQAMELAQKLDSQNRERQSLTEEMTKVAKNMWLEEGRDGKLIFVYKEEWEHGIVGLVAGRLVEEFYRPAIVVAVEGEFSRASARSINGFDMIGAIRASCFDILGSHGGHPMAAGFTVETKLLEEVKKRLTEYAEKNLTEDSLVKSIKVDIELSLDDVNFNLFENLRKLEPFGLGNSEPVFVSRGLVVKEAKLVGREGKHLSFYFKSPVSNVFIRGIAFNMGNIFPQIKPEKVIDVVYNLLLDEWNGDKRLQLRIKDVGF